MTGQLTPEQGETAFAGLVLAGVAAAASAGKGLSYGELAGILERTLAETEHSGPPYTDDRFADAVHRLTREGLIARLGEGVEGADHLVPGVNFPREGLL